jgi:nucleotide-binding universal stress UspA family protein
MMHLRKILFPVDFSEACAAMAPAVHEMARRFGASITLFHAFNAVPVFIRRPANVAPLDAESQPIPYSPEVRALRLDEERLLEEFAQAHFQGVDHAQKIEDGDPALAIEWAVKQEGVDLITMPTTGQGKFRRLLVGSVTGKILHDIACPLFTSAHAAEPGLASPTVFQRIVCAVQMSHKEDDVLQAAGLFAHTYGARICLLHTHPSSKQDGQPTVRAVREAFERARRSAQGEPVEVHARILDADIEEGISQVVREEDADLVVVGRGHARDTFSRAWSHLNTIIHDSPCPVLSV